VKRQRPHRPGDPHTGIVSGLWPQLGDDDPRQYDLDVAYSEVVTGRTLSLQTGEWGPSPQTGPGPCCASPVSPKVILAVIRP
jgi:hypothetical protein